MMASLPNLFHSPTDVPHVVDAILKEAREDTQRELKNMVFPS